MADASKAKDFLNEVLGYGDKISQVYQRVRLADKGVATPIVYETNGSKDPLVESGKPAAVTGNDPFAQIVNNTVDKAAMAYAAKQANDSMPYVVGLVALGITIYLLTRK